MLIEIISDVWVSVPDWVRWTAGTEIVGGCLLLAYGFYSGRSNA